MDGARRINDDGPRGLPIVVHLFRRADRGALRLEHRDDQLARRRRPLVADDLAGKRADLVPDADIVIVPVPLTPETTRLIDRALVARMPDGALVVNASRGAFVATDALLDEIETGRLRAALDVTDPEPLPPGPPALARPQPADHPARGR